MGADFSMPLQRLWSLYVPWRVLETQEKQYINLVDQPGGGVHETCTRRGTMGRASRQARVHRSHSPRIQDLLQGRPKRRRRFLLELAAIVGVFVMLAVGIMLGNQLLMVIFP